MQCLLMNVYVSSDVKYYPQDDLDKSVAHFDVAYNTYGGQPVFFRAVTFGRNAQKAEQYVTKGTGLLVRCQLKPISYMKRNEPVEVRTFELVINEFEMISTARTKNTQSSMPEASSDPDGLIE